MDIRLWNRLAIGLLGSCVLFALGCGGPAVGQQTGFEPGSGSDFDKADYAESQCGDLLDAFEPNNDRNHAAIFSVKVELSDDLVLCNGDEDWYQVDLTEWEHDGYHPWIKLFSISELEDSTTLYIDLFDADDPEDPFAHIENPIRMVEGRCIDPVAHPDILVRISHSPISDDQVPGIPYKLGFQFVLDPAQAVCHEYKGWW